MGSFAVYTSRDALPPAGENIATLLGGMSLASLPAATKTALLALMGTLPADLAAANSDIVVQKDQAKAATAAADDIQAELQAVCDSVFNSLKANNAPKAEFDLCGFLYPFASRSAYDVPVAPTDLGGIGISNGTVYLTWNGNNPSGYVGYEVHRREGDEGPWGIVGTTTRQKYTDMGIEPGQYYEYKVRAVNKKGTASAFSGGVVIYGVIEPTP